MTDNMPDEIWAYHSSGDGKVELAGTWENQDTGDTKYIRADLAQNCADIQDNLENDLGYLKAKARYLRDELNSLIESVINIETGVIRKAPEGKVE